MAYKRRREGEEGGAGGKAQAGGKAEEEDRPGPRHVIPDFNSLGSLLEALKGAKNILVVAGAGISVSSGIPDFRGKNGVYEIARKLDLGLGTPEDLFDMEFFSHDPRPFFKFARALYPGKFTPSPAHRFLRTLEEKGKLLRLYTQNIDGLEVQAGIERFVACHGSFLTATCLRCRRKYSADDIRVDVMQQNVPRCSSCKGGVIKPDITFFGEALPHKVKRCLEVDRKKADLLLVMGTSLKVAPVSRVLSYLPPAVPQVLVNMEQVQPPRNISDGFDLLLLGTCDAVVTHLATELGWAAMVSEAETRNVPVLMPPNMYRFNVAACSVEQSQEMDGCAEENWEETDFVEVVRCDECSANMDGAQAIYSCRECWEFDLCSK
jgi:NAD-dependent deacetylase sirtuin 1